MRRIIIAAVAIATAIMLLPPAARAAPPPPVPVQIQPTLHLWVPWVLFGCTGSVVVSALVADWKDNRQLSYSEAYSCGLLYWFSPPQPPPKPRKHH